jgi:hypothetical protein
MDPPIAAGWGWWMRTRGRQLIHHQTAVLYGLQVQMPSGPGTVMSFRFSHL